MLLGQLSSQCRSTALGMLMCHLVHLSQKPSGGLTCLHAMGKECIFRQGWGWRQDQCPPSAVKREAALSLHPVGDTLLLPARTMSTPMLLCCSDILSFTRKQLL